MIYINLIYYIHFIYIKKFQRKSFFEKKDIKYYFFQFMTFPSNNGTIWCILVYNAYFISIEFEATFFKEKFQQNSKKLWKKMD